VRRISVQPIPGAVDFGVTLEIFVYGTLKRGMINHHAMKGVGVDRAQVAYLRGFRLLEVPPGVRQSESEAGSAYPYPAMLRGAGLVIGEVHRLGASELHPDDALLVLDHLEREGHEYHRVKWWAVRRGARVRVWVYAYASAQLALRSKARAFRGASWRPPRGPSR
jgi:gamma-glutamylcyclotransferase (GGCT)/AIG2-like uncharacterized protein YtfP